MPGADYATASFEERGGMLINGSRKLRSTSMDEDSVDELGADDPGSPFNGTAASDRKRRRGVIEKRRRDRINSSLHDLKRLVPDNVHKPGTAKLEKAEILQATVDFIQRLYREGHVLSAEARAVELRRAGFKDCLLEVTRLLSSFDDQVTAHTEEMRRSLLAHLQQCDQQRDQEAKAYLAHVAAVANAIGAHSTGTLRQTITTSSSTGNSSAGVVGTGKSVKRGPPAVVPTSGLDVPHGFSKSSTATTRHCAQAATYLSHLDPHCSDGAHSTPSPYTLTDLGANTTTPAPAVGKVCSVPSYAYSPVKRLSGTGVSSCYHPADHNYYATNYITNGAECAMETNAYPSTPGIPIPNHGHLSAQQQQQPQHHQLQQPQHQAQSHPPQSYGSNYSRASQLGPNESQSTSSPPFHSTPDDTEVGTSPSNIFIGAKMANSTESYSDPSVLSMGPLKPDPLIDDSRSRAFPATPNKSSQHFYPYRADLDRRRTPERSDQVSAKLEDPSLDNHNNNNSNGSKSTNSGLIYPSYPQLFDSSNMCPIFAPPLSNHSQQFPTTNGKPPSDWCLTSTESVDRSIHTQHQAQSVGYAPQWDYAFQTL